MNKFIVHLMDSKYLFPDGFRVDLNPKHPKYLGDFEGVHHLQG